MAFQDSLHQMETNVHVDIFSGFPLKSLFISSTYRSNGSKQHMQLSYYYDLLNRTSELQTKFEKNGKGVSFFVRHVAAGPDVHSVLFAKSLLTTSRLLKSRRCSYSKILFGLYCTNSDITEIEEFCSFFVIVMWIYSHVRFFNEEVARNARDTFTRYFMICISHL